MCCSHDSYLFRAFPPPLTGNEAGLNDSAYVGPCEDSGRAIAPFKRPKGGVLTAEQKMFNEVHSWYRATIEHL